MKFKFAGAQFLQLGHEFRVSQQFHRLNHATEALGGNDVNHGTFVSGDGNEGTRFGGADRRSGVALQFADAVCIFHAGKLYSIGRGVNPAGQRRGSAAGQGRVIFPAGSVSSRHAEMARGAADATGQAAEPVLPR